MRMHWNSIDILRTGTFLKKEKKNTTEFNEKKIYSKTAKIKKNKRNETHQREQ